MKIKNLLARCIVKILSGSQYSFTCLSGEYITAVEHLQEFGLASRMPVGAAANGIACFYAGDRGNASLLIVEVPSLKPTLQDGESALFNAFSSLVKLDTTGRVQLNGTANSGLIKIQALTDKLNAHIEEYNAHTHLKAQSTGTPTAPVVPAASFVKADYENTKVVH